MACSPDGVPVDLKLQPTPAEAPGASLRLGPIRQRPLPARQLQQAYGQPRHLALHRRPFGVLGVSQVVLAAFPAYVKESMGQTNTVVIQGMMACSGIGIIIGSLIAGKASRHHIETGLVPLGALGIVAALFSCRSSTPTERWSSIFCCSEYPAACSSCR